MITDDTRLETLRGTVIGCAIEVHRQLGPGLLESIYDTCLCIELASARLEFERQRPVKLTYRGQPVAGNLFIDIVVENLVVVEVKAVSALAPVHSAQVLTYLKLADLPAGLLLNFNSFTMAQGIRRIVHPMLYKKHREPND